MNGRSNFRSTGDDSRERLFSSGGELARLCREKDWSNTPLGPTESWSASLRVTANLVVAAPVSMVVLWGPQLVQIYNDGYRDVMGAKHPGGLGQPTSECWPEVWEFHGPLCKGVVDEGRSFTFDNQRLIIERNGHPEETFFTLGYSPVFDDAGAVGGVLVTVVETSAAVERARSEAALRDSEERLRVALEAAELGTWDLDLTNDTASIRSLRHDQIFGYEKHQPDWGQNVAVRHMLPEDRPIAERAFARAAETGVLSFEARVRWPDGSVHWIAPLGRTYYDDEGRPTRMTGVVADVTERKGAEEARRESEERFRQLADVIPHIVWRTDPNGAFEFNNRRFTEYTGAAPGSMTVHEYAARHVHPDDVAAMLSVWQEALRERQPFLIEHRLKSAAGEYRWFVTSAVPQLDERSGDTLHWFGTTTDVHSQKAEVALRSANVRLVESDRQKDEFLAMLAHELRNPLAAIGNTVKVLEASLERPRHQRHLDILNRQMDTLRGLVDDLLDVSRITRGLVELKQIRVELASVANNALESVQALMDEKRHEVSVTLPRKPMEVIGDPVRLEQILVNLLTNAAKYTDSGGHVALRLERHGDCVELHVSDNGIGIPQEVRERIFELFRQAERGMARSEGGLGVGLTIVRSLVELQGGSIEAKSRGLGKGAEFVVTLPLAPPEKTAAKPVAAPPAAVESSKRVLIVEDNEDIAETLAQLMAFSGHETAVVHDGLTALKAAEEFDPEVALLDIGLPGIDGYEIARRLRRNPRTQSAALAALTGYGQSGDIERARSAGFDQHFTKPVDLAALQAFISAARSREADDIKDPQ